MESAAYGNEREQRATRPGRGLDPSGVIGAKDSPNLDFIRAAAVLCVFFGHLHLFLNNRETEISWHFGQIGVLIFFVHTSLVLMMSLDRSRLTGSAFYLSFYCKRLFRLYPLSIFCVIIAFLRSATSWPIGWDGPPSSIYHWSWTELASNLTLTTNLFYVNPMVGGLWTLPLEVQMYVALPFLFLLAKRRPVWMLLAGWWLVCLPLAILQARITGRLNVFGYAPCFVAGVIAWRIIISGSTRRLPGWLWPVAFVASWSIFLVSTQETIMSHRWAFSLVLGLLIPWFKEISYKPLVKASHVIAKYSYGIYLSHIALILFSFRLPYSPTVQWLVFGVLAVVVPVLMFHFIESPMIGFGQRVSNHFWPASRGLDQAARSPG